MKQFQDFSQFIYSNNNKPAFKFLEKYFVAYMFIKFT